MSEPYLGEIRMFGGSYAPAGWQFCDGSLLSISENDALFNLIGTIYGGDGQNDFGVPDMRGRVPMHQGSGNTIGTMAGSEQVTLIGAQLPQHNHPLQAAGVPGDTGVPTSGVALSSMGPSTTTQITTYAAYGNINQVTLAPTSITIAGGSQPHDNFQPTMAVSFIICLQGIYPSQN